MCTCVCVYGCIPVHVYACIRVSTCVLVVCVTTMWIWLCNLDLVTGEFRPVFTVNPIRWWLEDDTRDDLEIWTGLCSADQMEIRARNRVISYECLLLCYYLFTIVSGCCMITPNISRKSLAYFTIVICIISCDISECSFYLYSSFEHLSASFPVLLLPLLT